MQTATGFDVVAQRAAARPREAEAMLGAALSELEAVGAGDDLLEPRRLALARFHAAAGL